MADLRTAPVGTRVALAAVVGTACGLVVSRLAVGPVAILAGWDAAAAAFTVSVWAGVAGLSAADARRLATSEDPSRALADLLLLAASVASLVGAAYTLHEARGADGAQEVALIVLATSSVALSWAVVHVVFMLRYARLYYAEPTGGIEFPGGEAPAYREFAYLALTVGMTYQVSDTALTSSDIRSTVLRQALLSYLFGVCIVGLIINVVAGLLR